MKFVNFSVFFPVLFHFPFFFCFILVTYLILQMVPSFICIKKIFLFYSKGDLKKINNDQPQKKGILIASSNFITFHTPQTFFCKIILNYITFYYTLMAIMN